MIKDPKTSILISVCLGFASLFLLSGCATDPKPKAMGVCKSCKPYYVRGEWHTPQKHYEYDEVGLASWYGPGFHGKPKPHGEPYDQFEMTAAHKTLPIPSIVKVTNLENGYSTKVLIDDRGPFVYKGRIIDLSVAAAKEIGVYGKGTAKVRVTALQEESDRFAKHLSQFRNARCPNGRRWVKVFQQDLANNSGDLVPTVYTGGDSGFANHHKAQSLAYVTPKKQQEVQQLKPQKLNQVTQEIVPSKKVDRLLETYDLPKSKDVKQKQPSLSNVSLKKEAKQPKDKKQVNILQKTSYAKPVSKKKIVHAKVSHVSQKKR